MMKTTQFISTVAVWVVGLSWVASAAPTLTIQQGSYQYGQGGEFMAVVNTAGLPGHPAGSSFQTFCVEHNEYLSFGGTYYVVVNTGAVNGGVGGQLPDNPHFDPLDPRTAWLYDQFVKGTLPGYFDNPNGRQNSAGALQNAIWFIENEITEQPVGLAKTFYDMADTSGSKGIGHIRVLNMYNDAALTSNAQDLLVAMPAPAGLLLAGIGTALVGALRRRAL